MKRIIIANATAVTLALVIGVALPAVAERPASGTLWLNGTEVRTVVPPANVPAGSGTDPLYVVPNQAAVAGVGPGEEGYHGGRWAVHVVAWNAGVTPYPLTSGEQVMEAQAAGHITITRAPEQDNRCPILPGKGEQQESKY